jgi:hypothetical protein
MLRIIGFAPRLIPAIHGGRRLSPPARPPFTILRMFCEALQEGLAAHRHYEELRSKGLAHESALRDALAFAPAPSRAACEALTPLWFAGKA